MRDLMSIPLALLVAATLAGAQTLTVPGSHPTIQSAINAASPGNLIQVMPGTYAEDLDLMGKSLVLVSTGGAAQTTILGSGTGRVVNLSGCDSLTVFAGFTVSGGQGGILITGTSAPLVSQCRITGNHSVGLEGGGGILIEAAGGAISAPVVLDCEIDGNTSNNAGGGIQVDVRDTTSACNLILNRNHIHDNLAIGANGSSAGCAVGGGPCATSGGGGLHLFSRTGLPATGTISLSMADCRVTSNTSVADGGGLFLENVASAVIENSRIAGNVAVYGKGGGLHSQNCTLTMRSCYLVGNGSNVGGGGLLATATFPTLTTLSSATISDNQAMIGGGIQADSQFVTVDLANSIVRGNTTLDVFSTSATINAIHSNLGNGVPVTGTGNVNIDPLFIDRAGGDYHLARRSPCIDAGDPFAIGITSTDGDGTPRIVNGLIDIGADEVPPATLPGSNEDVELHTFTTEGGDPNVSAIALSPGDVLLVRLTSAGGGLLGAPALIVGQAFTSGFPPISPPSLPGVHLDGFGLQVIYGDPSGAFLGGPTLPIGGIVLAYLVPPGLAGFSFRLQGFAVTPLALNGAYAVTDAHDLIF